MKTFTLAGKTYTAEVRNGVRYVDGMTIPEFLNKLADEGNTEALVDALQIGAAVKKGTLPGGSAQIAAKTLHAGRTKQN